MNLTKNRSKKFLSISACRLKNYFFEKVFFNESLVDYEINLSFEIRERGLPSGSTPLTRNLSKAPSKEIINCNFYSNLN